MIGNFRFGKDKKTPAELFRGRWGSDLVWIYIALEEQGIFYGALVGYLAFEIIH